MSNMLLYSRKDNCMENMVDVDNGFFRVIKYSHKNESQRAHMWECECRCGNIVVRSTAEIKRARTERCNECSYGVTKGNWTNHYIAHGLCLKGKRHPLIQMRNRIMTRCYNAKKSDFPYYQGKGIIVCDEWKDVPKSFYEWAFANGWQQGLTIDRIDPNGNYDPSNCRFITKNENSQRVCHRKEK